MSARTLAPPRSLRASAALVLIGSLALGCRTDTPAAALSTAPEGEDSESPDTAAEEPAAVASVDRDLWFSIPAGNEAIVARERQDFEAAAVLLQQVLDEPGATGSDRAGAHWLLGLQDNDAERYLSAAARFESAAEVAELAPLRVRLQALRAQALLDGSKPAEARELLENIDKDAGAKSAVAEDLAVMAGDAKLRSRDDPAAIEAYEAYLDAFPKGGRRAEVEAKLARLLSRGDALAAKKRAVKLYEKLLIKVPLSDFGEEAARVLPKLRSSAGAKRESKDARDFQRSVSLAKMEAQLGRRRYASTIKAANALLGGSSLDVAGRCRTLYAKGSAIFKQRNRKGARPVFERAAAACKGNAKLVTYEVKSRYQGARGLYAEGKYGKAALAFESLAKEHAKNSYSDDAWVLAGESWSEANDEAKATLAFERGLAVGGDMQDEARRRLLLLAFAAGDNTRALALCDAALAKRIVSPVAKSKLQYFRGRALAALGKSSEAADAWVAAVETDPLNYPALQSLSRLQEQGAAELERGLAALQAKGEAASAASIGPRAERALILARLGLGKEARQELVHADIDGWPAVSVLNRAGLYAEGQKLIANLGTSWRTKSPDASRERFELAYPLPFNGLISKFETSHDVPHLLAYAVMKTESRFNPGATSWAGARGLIQLMPGTAKTVASDAGMSVKPEQLYQPEVNLDLGMRYLAKLVGRFGGGDPAVALAVPSYNAGAGAVDRWLGERGTWDLDLFIEAIPFDETRHYTQSVLGRWWAYRWLYAGKDSEPASRVPYMPLTIPSR